MPFLGEVFTFNKVVTVILIKNSKIVKRFKTSKKNAKKVVARGQGRWRDVKKNILILYPRNEDGSYQVPDVCYYHVAPTIEVSSTIRAVHQCVIEQEELKCKGVEKNKIPLLAMEVPGFVRKQIQETLQRRQMSG